MEEKRCLAIVVIPGEASRKGAQEVSLRHKALGLSSTPGRLLSTLVPPEKDSALADISAGGRWTKNGLSLRQSAGIGIHRGTPPVLLIHPVLGPDRIPVMRVQRSSATELRGDTNLLKGQVNNNVNNLLLFFSPGRGHGGWVHCAPARHAWSKLLAPTTLSFVSLSFGKTSGLHGSPLAVCVGVEWQGQ